MARDDEQPYEGGYEGEEWGEWEQHHQVVGHFGPQSTGAAGNGIPLQEPPPNPAHP